MRKGLVLLGAAALAMLLTPAAVAQNRGVTFTSIGYLDPSAPILASSVMSMNPSGTVFYVTPNWTLGGYAVEWTKAGGWGQHIGSVDAYPKVSANGTIMVGGIYPNSSPAYLWPGTWQGTQDAFSPIPPNPDYAPCGSSRMSFYDMGGDGDYAVGLTWSGCSAARGWLWEKSTNTTISLGSPNAQSTRANAVTANGKTVAGWVQMLGGTRRGAQWKSGAWNFLGDPNGLEPKACVVSHKGCTSNSADPVRGCAEYVDDASCANKGTCTGGVCVGGWDAGKTCTSSSQCGGTCAGGPSNGLRCTSNSSCPDTPVCLANPDWNDDLFKGEAFDITSDGRFTVGQHFDYGLGWDSGYRSNPDGTYDEIPVLPDFPYFITPMAISDRGGKVVAGFAGGQLFGYAPIVWTQVTGTVDLQQFLISQGLDELYFWYLMRVHAMSADGLILGGVGYNPDGKLEGFVVDMHRVLICHACTGSPERTLAVPFDNLDGHIAAGDTLGSCEFKRSGGLSRTRQLRLDLTQKWQSGKFGKVLVQFDENALPEAARQFQFVAKPATP